MFASVSHGEADTAAGPNPHSLGFKNPKKPQASRQIQMGHSTLRMQQGWTGIIAPTVRNSSAKHQEKSATHTATVLLFVWGHGCCWACAFISVQHVYCYGSPCQPAMDACMNAGFGWWCIVNVVLTHCSIFQGLYS